LSVLRVRSRDERSVNMKTPPESFLLFKEELRKAQLEKERLKNYYEQRLAEVNQELCRLKEQIQSQQDMMRTTLEYASNLEIRLSEVKEEVAHATSKSRNSIY
jgi:membrane-anchored protein YejM (alkaline phosphatase superfamily)